MCVCVRERERESFPGQGPQLSVDSQMCLPLGKRALKGGWDICTKVVKMTEPRQEMSRKIFWSITLMDAANGGPSDVFLPFTSTYAFHVNPRHLSLLKVTFLVLWIKMSKAAVTWTRTFSFSLSLSQKKKELSDFLVSSNRLDKECSSTWSKPCIYCQSSRWSGLY